jgi:hypothetical protein
MNACRGCNCGCCTKAVVQGRQPLILALRSQGKQEGCDQRQKNGGDFNKHGNTGKEVDRINPTLFPSTAQSIEKI